MQARTLPCGKAVEEAEAYSDSSPTSLVTQREIEMLGTLDRTAQEQNHLTRNGLGGVNAGGPGPVAVCRDRRAEGNGREIGDKTRRPRRRRSRA